MPLAALTDTAVLRDGVRRARRPGLALAVAFVAVTVVATILIVAPDDGAPPAASASPAVVGADVATLARTGGLTSTEARRALGVVVEARAALASGSADRVTATRAEVQRLRADLTARGGEDPPAARVALSQLNHDLQGLLALLDAAGR